VKLQKKGIGVIWIIPPFLYKRCVEIGLNMGTIFRSPWIFETRFAQRVFRRFYVLCVAIISLFYIFFAFLLVILTNAKTVYFAAANPYIRNPILLHILVSLFKIVGRRVICDVGDIPVLYEKVHWGDKRWFHLIEKPLLQQLFLAYKKTDLLITVAHGVSLFLEKLVNHLGTCTEIVVAPAGADLRLYNANLKPYGIRKKYGIGRESTLIGWIGVQGNKKGVLPVIEAISQNLNKKDITFIIGGIKIDHCKLKEIEKKTGVRTIFLGPVPYNVSGRIYKECDLIIAPLNLEKLYFKLAFSTKIWIATALKKPVVATVSDFNKTMVKDFPNIIVVDEKPESFVEAVRSFIERRAEYISICEHMPSDLIHKVSTESTSENEVKHILNLMR